MIGESASELLERLGAPPQAVTEDIIGQIAVERDAAFNLARENVDYLALLAAPTTYRYTFPPVLLAVWSLLIEKVVLQRDFSQIALGLPRGIGKTMLMKLFILHCVLFTDKRFIIIIAATATLAENILSDVDAMLSEPNIKKIFGDWELGKEQDTQSVKRFGFRGRNITIAAIGAGGSMRGITIGNNRPDVMVFDDVQKREEVDSRQVSENLERWMVGTAMKSKSPHGCMFIYIGNMYPSVHTILKKLRRNPQWTSFITGAILEDGTALWPELQPLPQLLAELENDMAMGHPEIWFAEVMNDDEAGANTKFDSSKVPLNPYEEDTTPQGQMIIIDPATDKKNADLITIGHFSIFDATPVCDELLEDSWSPGEMIRQALVLGLRTGCRVIAVESTAYQYSLLYWFNFICTQYQIEGFHFVEIYRTGMSKNSAINSMFKQLVAQPQPELYLHSKVRNRVIVQAIQFKPLKTDNVDGILDVLAFATKAFETYAPLMPIDGVYYGHDAALPVGVIEHNSLF